MKKIISLMVLLAASSFALRAEAGCNHPWEVLECTRVDAGPFHFWSCCCMPYYGDQLNQTPIQPKPTLMLALPVGAITPEERQRLTEKPKPPAKETSLLRLGLSK